MRLFGGGSDDDDDDSEWRYSLEDLDDLDEDDPGGNAAVDRDAAGPTADVGTDPAEAGNELTGDGRARDGTARDGRAEDERARDGRAEDERAGDRDDDGGGAGVAGSFEPSETIEAGDVDPENVAFVLLGVLIAGVAAGHYVLLAL